MQMYRRDHSSKPLQAPYGLAAKYRRKALTHDIHTFCDHTMRAISVELDAELMESNGGGDQRSTGFVGQQTESANPELKSKVCADKTPVNN
jgi:hypothetical protein